MFPEIVVHPDKVKRGGNEDYGVGTLNNLRTEGRSCHCASDMFSNAQETVMHLCHEVVGMFVRFVIRVYTIKVNEILPDGLMSFNGKI